MSKKQNQLWRLDLLETHFAQKPNRFPRTKALLKAKGKAKAQLLPSSEEDAQREIEALKQDVFAKKLHSSLLKYNRALKKIIKTYTKTNTKKTELEKEFYDKLDVQRVSNIRIVKICIKIFGLNPKRLEHSRPSFVDDWIIDAVMDKESKLNPSFYYNELSKDEKNWYSKLMNNKELNELVGSIEHSFKIILGPVKDKDSKKDIEDVKQSDDEEESESESESKDENEPESGSEFESDNEDVAKLEDLDEDAFSQFDNLVAGSEDEESEVELDGETNYNEITDDEPSEAEEQEEEEEEEEEEVDDFFEEEPKKEKKVKEDKKEKQKIALPELTMGYISGGSDSEAEEDEIVKEATQSKKKNRRGQRARQKIWEAKYGRGANHVKKSKEEYEKMRLQKQKEFEEREAKRAAKAMEDAGGSGANASELGERRARSGDVPFTSEHTAPVKPSLHPSWEAKKRQEEALKKVKFQGKKITF